MKKICFQFTYFIFFTWLLMSCNMAETQYKVSSPDGANSIEFSLTDSGQPRYMVKHNNKTVIDTSLMSFDFKNLPSLKDHFKIVKVDTSSFDETWPMPWGEQLEVRNHYNEMKVYLEEQTEDKRKLNIHFKVYNDGVGFRYEFPEQANMDEVLITDENTEFKLTGDHKVWWIPGDWDTYEQQYSETKFSEIDAQAKRVQPLAATYIPENAVNTPVTMKTDDGLYLSFHEADLTNYAGMTLKVDPANLDMMSELVGSDNLGGKAKVKTPFNTPWRTIQIAEKPGDLIESRLILNLNDPNAIGDV
ncbi:MAG TPA: glycoside hydrolase family 97 N-terminal domain-containing protein, partial [Flavobacteriaceae bacterium]|nr:glycoside hydrolase family 97 N-terminal domain-containing protein [Flavobacteriaceae bacterium]